MTPAELRDAVLNSLDGAYELINVAYDDKLMPEQITQVVECDWEGLWDSGLDWELDARHGGAEYYAEQAVRDTFQALEREGRIEDSSETYDDFHGSDEWDEVMETIKESDTSDPYKQLASQSGYVLMRQELDPDALMGPLSAYVVVDAIRRSDETNLALSEHNEAVINEALNEANGSGYIYALLVYSVAVSDLYEIRGRVAIRNPHLFLGNPHAGNGWVSEEPLDATFWFDREALTSDASCWGYSWKDTCGCSDSSYQAEITKVIRPDLSTPEKVIQYLTS